MVRLGVRAAFVDGAFVDGDVEITDGEIGAVGLAPGVGTRIALPGFVDLQVNGFAGVDFTDADSADYDAVGSALAATGVTAYQPTLITLPEAALTRALEQIAAATTATRGVRILGAHLEGPFLSPLRPGSHDSDHLQLPDAALLERLLAAGPVSLLTLAPELPGALDLVPLLRDRDVVVSCGHTDAGTETADDAFDAGATAVTHLFNAMRPFSHRDPGLAGVALARDDVTVMIIPDGDHLAVETVRTVARAATGRYAIVTDAIAGAAMHGGVYSLGGREVAVRNGTARLADGTLAGSVLTMDRAVRNLIDAGIAEEDAVTAATATPARLIGRPELGTLRPGTPADVVIVDREYRIHRTLIAGIAV